MEKRIRIAPSILAGDFGNLSLDAKRAEEAGADMLHVDVMDGHFVPNITIGPQAVNALKKAVSIPLDVHLMISYPDKYVKKFAESGADIITIHIESSSNIGKTLKLIKECRKKVGLSLNPDTPFQKIKSFLPDIDMILFMTVFPGFGGQNFISDVLPKIAEARKYLEENSLDKIDIEIDGGIDFKTAGEAVKAGVDILVSGTAIYTYSSLKEAVDKLRNCV